MTAAYTSLLITTDGALDGGITLLATLQRTPTRARRNGLSTRTARRWRSTVGGVKINPPFLDKDAMRRLSTGLLENSIRRRRRDPNGSERLRGSATDSPFRRNVSGHSQKNMVNGSTPQRVCLLHIPPRTTSSNTSYDPRRSLPTLAENRAVS